MHPRRAVQPLESLSETLLTPLRIPRLPEQVAKRDLIVNPTLQEASFERARAKFKAAEVSKDEAERSPKKAKRRLSFCRRMRGMKDKLTSAETRNDPDSRINKALRKWEC